MKEQTSLQIRAPAKIAADSEIQVVILAPQFPELLQSFLSFLDVKQRSADTYTKALKQFFLWLRDHEIERPRRDDVVRWRDSLEREGKKATTRQTYVVAVRQFFRWTAQEGLYPNIADHVKGAKVDRRTYKRDALTAQQAAEILAKTAEDKNLQGLRDYAILICALSGGLRTIEISRANLDDFRTKGSQYILTVQGKGRDDRGLYVIMPEKAERAIREYLKARGKTKRGAPLFASCSNRDAGSRLTTRSISRIIKSRMIAAGYNSAFLTAHSLRHTAGTLAVQNGASLEQAQQFLRHSSIESTMVYYHEKEREENKSEEIVMETIFKDKTKTNGKEGSQWPKETRFKVPKYR